MKGDGLELFFMKEKGCSVLGKVKAHAKWTEQDYFYEVIPEENYVEVREWCRKNHYSMFASHITDGRITYIFRRIG